MGRFDIVARWRIVLYKSEQSHLLSQSQIGQSCLSSRKTGTGSKNTKKVEEDEICHLCCFQVCKIMCGLMKAGSGSFFSGIKLLYIAYQCSAFFSCLQINEIKRQFRMLRCLIISVMLSSIRNADPVSTITN